MIDANAACTRCHLQRPENASRATIYFAMCFSRSPPMLAISAPRRGLNFEPTRFEVSIGCVAGAAACAHALTGKAFLASHGYFPQCRENHHGRRRPAVRAIDILPVLFNHPRVVFEEINLPTLSPPKW